MRLHIQPTAARERLAADLQALGGRAFTVGETLELSYPQGRSASPDQERIELLFFVRAWAASDPSVQAEIVA